MQDDDKVMWVPKDLSRSKAYWKLTGLAPKVLTELYRRRVMKNIGTDDDPDWTVYNNGAIEFRETEARKFGATRKTLRRAFRQLGEHGFVTKTRGGGRDRLPCRFFLSRKWRKRGFVEKPDKKKTTRSKVKGYGPGKCPECGHAHDGDGDQCKSCEGFRGRGS